METVEYPEDGPLLSQIGEGRRAATAQRRKALGYRFARTGVRVVILSAALGTTYTTFRLPQDTFVQSLLCNLAAGLLVFLAAAPLLRGVRRHQTATVAGGVVVVVCTLTGAYISGPVLQSLLLNIGVGAALILALDLNIARWFDAIARADGIARHLLEEAAAKVEAAESTLDYKYAIHDFLKLPRPYRFGGISLADGEHLMPVVSFTSREDLPTAQLKL